MDLFAISQLSFMYEKKHLILDALDLTIQKNRFTAICGCNGSGKSTLLKILAGILQPSSGTVKIYGKPISHYPKNLLYRHIAYVPQQHSIEIPLTVEEIIKMGRYPHEGLFAHHERSAQQLLDQTIALTQLEKYRTTLFNTLSGGEKQKVLIAKAICQTDDIILLDEPTSSLDIANRVEIFDILKQLTQQGRSVISVSHDINEVYRNADTAVFIRDGKALTGPKEEIMSPDRLQQLYGTPIHAIEENAVKLFYY